MMKINKSLSTKLDQIEGFAEEAVEDELREIADTAIYLTLTSVGNKGTPGAVDTGAYISSFSITYGAGRPRGKSSRRKRRDRTDLPQLGQAAMADLYSDISKLDLSTVSSVELRNNSPHAYQVENKHGYFIFGQLERIFNG